MSGCELCEPKDVVFESDFACVRYDSQSLGRGHVIVVPRRHVAGFFDMSAAEQGSVLALLNRAKKLIDEKHQPDGYNIGVNVGKAEGPVHAGIPLEDLSRRRAAALGSGPSAAGARLASRSRACARAR